MRFAFESDRIRFVSARASMRKILACYLGTPPQAIRFKYGPYGKPSLVNEADPVFFSFSRSAGVGLLAVGTGLELGIDIEHIRKDIETVEIAESFFSEAERRDLATVAPELRHQTFFNCWTRKEAILKGIGTGLNLRLDGFDVSSVPGATAQLTASRLPLINMTRWILFSIDLGIDFAAALAVATGGVSINVKMVEIQLEP
jgi:4'-phosphopantetheinyl transferase